MTLVVATRLVWTVVAVLVAVNLALLLWGPPDTPTPLAGGSWGVWAALAPEERRSFLRGYRALVQQPEAGQILRHCAEYEALPEAEQARLRALAHLLEETIAAQPAQRRRELLMSPPGAQAFHVWKLVTAQGAGLPTTVPALP